MDCSGECDSPRLHLQLEEGRHICWVNPSDSGEPPRVKWQLPAGVRWPASPCGPRDAALWVFGRVPGLDALALVERDDFREQRAILMGNN
jgi:hypothetical protein